MYTLPACPLHIRFAFHLKAPLGRRLDLVSVAPTPWMPLGKSPHTFYCGLAGGGGFMFGPAAATVLVAKEPEVDPNAKATPLQLPVAWEDASSESTQNFYHV